MVIYLNGNACEVQQENLAAVLREQQCDFTYAATAVNGIFIPRDQREEFALRDGDAVEVVMPMQGG